MTSGEISIVPDIIIHSDRTHSLLGLSQKAYINRVLKRFNMDGCSRGDAPNVKEISFLNPIH